MHSTMLELPRFRPGLRLAVLSMTTVLLSTLATQAGEPATPGKAANQGDFAHRRAHNWHQWRGPEATGVAPHGNPPVNWSGTENVAWKTRIPGRGHASPVVWEDKVFLLSAVPTERIDPSVPPPNEQPKRAFGIRFPRHFHRYIVVAVERASGKILWERTATTALPHEGHHPDNTFASASATTDGESVFASFGSRGIYRYDFNGELVWSRDLGEVATRKSFGEASSPVVHHGALIVIQDQEGSSRITVLDAATGETRWERPRDEPSAWSTPLVFERRGRTQVVVNASNRVRSYDLASGETIWECGGQVGNVTPAPVRWNDLVVCMSGYKGKAIYAISVDSIGDVTETAKVAWHKDRGAPYVPSPLLLGDTLYYLQSNSAIFSSVHPGSGKPRVDPESGKAFERLRLPGLDNIYASPVAAADRVYVVGRDGNTVVLDSGPALRVLATNPLGERVDASPAIVGSELFLRGEEHLFCLRNPALASPAASTSSWSEMRGPTSNGHAHATDLPAQWSETENVRWKTAIHDLGWSTPAILGNQIWLTTATQDGKKMYAVCVARDSGRIIHDILLFENETPRPLGNSLNCYAAPSPTIEPGRVYVHFGSYGTACLDTSTGETLWERRDLPCNHFRGPGSSVVLFEDLLLLHMDGSDHQYVAALNKATGETVWKTLRSTDYGDLDENGNPKANGDFRKAFNTPLLTQIDGTWQMISAGAKAMYGYAPRTGEELWTVTFKNHSSSPRPVRGHGLFYLCAGYGGDGLLAVRTGGRGDVTATHVAWTHERQIPRRSSPVLVDDQLYFVSDQGIATSLDARSGEQIWVQRLEGEYSSSAIYADNKIYFSNQDGKTTVIRPGRECNIVGSGQLDEGIMASPAVVDDGLYLRTRSHLYRIQK